MRRVRSGLKATVRFIREVLLGAKGEPPRGYGELPVYEPSIRVLLPVNGQWFAAESDEAMPARLFGHYLDPSTRIDEVLAAAVLVHADGVPWNTTEHSEGIYHIECWFQAITELLQGTPSRFIWAWEETGMTAELRGHLVVLEEQTHHIAYRLPPVCFDLRKFAYELARATRGVVERVAWLKEFARRRHPAEWQAAVKAHEESTSAGRVQVVTSQADSDAALSALESLEQQLLSAAHARQPDEAEDRAARLHEVIEYLVSERLSALWAQLAAEVGFAA
jgi:hypothetical protein